MAEHRDPRDERSEDHRSERSEDHRSERSEDHRNERSEESFDVQLDDRVRRAYGDVRERDRAAEARVLAKLAEPRAARRGWWFEPHLFELRPAPVVMAAAALLAVALWAGSRFRTVEEVRGERGAGTRELASTDVRSSGAVANVPVTFVLRTTDAARVNLVGDFNNWDAEATPLQRDVSRDQWIVELEISRGMHNYAFVVDGREWRTDPSAPLAADATFGGKTSVLVVEGAGL